VTVIAAIYADVPIKRLFKVYNYYFQNVWFETFKYVAGLLAYTLTLSHTIKLAENVYLQFSACLRN